MTSMQSTDVTDLIAVPLDYADVAGALSLVDLLGDRCTLYKVGLELFCSAGPSVLHELRARNKDVFLDLKLHDIPNTVAKAVAQCRDHQVRFLTVHVGGGESMLRAAREAAEERVGLLGVTVLTSLDGPELGRVWGRTVRAVDDEVLRLAELAEVAELAGVVCSAQEAGAVRRVLRRDREVVTPGIRLAGDPVHDQRRVTTPSEAVAAGATRLVVGRSITGAQDPLAAYDQVLADAQFGGSERTR